jgi:hypothetical protein
MPVLHPTARRSLGAIFATSVGLAVLLLASKPPGALHDHYTCLRVDGHVAWSGDGGATWKTGIRPADERFRKWFDAAVAFDLHGHAFVAYLVMDNVSMTDREGQLVRRLLGGGRTWEAPVTLIEHPANHEPLLDHFPNIVADNGASSSRAGTVYVIRDRIVEVGAREELRLVKSTDDGRTWSTSKVISRHEGGIAHSTVIGLDGTIYVMIARFDAKGTEIVVEASRDGGDTWDPPSEVSDADGPTARRRSGSGSRTSRLGAETGAGSGIRGTLDPLPRLSRPTRCWRRPRRGGSIRGPHRQSRQRPHPS